MRLYYGANLHRTDTINEEYTNALTGVTALDRMYLGVNTSGTYDIFYDDYADGTLDWTGPSQYLGGLLWKTSGQTGTYTVSADDTGGIAATETPAAGGGAPPTSLRTLRVRLMVCRPLHPRQDILQVLPSTFTTHSSLRSQAGTRSLRILNATSIQNCVPRW